MHITSIDITKYTSLGSADYPAYSLFDSIKEVVAYRISPEASALFCEPTFDAGGSEIDYATVLDGNPLPLDELDAKEKNITLDKLVKYSAEIEALAKTYTRSNDPDSMRFGRNLRNALCVPSSRHIYVINNQPVLTAWGFKNRGATAAFDTAKDLQLITENSVEIGPTHSEFCSNSQETLKPLQRNRNLPWWYLLLLIGGILLLLLLFFLLFGDSDAKKESPLSQVTEPNVVQPTPDPVTTKATEGGTDAPVKTSNLKLSVAATTMVKTSNSELRVAAAPTINVTDQKSVQADTLKDSLNDLHIPAEAVSDGDMSFLAGKWVSITGLTSSDSKENVIIYYIFDAQGVGTTTIIQEKTGRCTAPVKAEFRESKRLYIEDQTDVFCSSTTYFPKSTVVCDVAEGGEAVCRGYQDNNHYDVSIKRFVANEELKTGETTTLSKGSLPVSGSVGATLIYKREYFGNGWGDDDRDCQDTRQEILIGLSTSPVRFTNTRKCTVLSGKWISPFTNEVHYTARELDVDHQVPLKWAWNHGAYTWNADKRYRFANDPINLLPVEASLNRSKGFAGLEWLPPANQCAYIARFVRIGRMYGLTFTPSEAVQVAELLEKCR